MGWKDVGEAERFDFEEEGDQLTGLLVDIKDTREYDSKVYTIRNAEGDSFYFFGCHKLDSILEIMKGQYIDIIYKGKVELEKGKTMREFKISIWKGKPGEKPKGFTDDVPF